MRNKQSSLSERFVKARWSKFANPRPKHLDKLANNIIDCAEVYRQTLGDSSDGKLIPLYARTRAQVELLHAVYVLDNELNKIESGK